ncbi:MAG: hypothetical protein UY81_C0002G0020 [Candidatus Giovannonibacteria bacterium GW2011_GWA2_53_7]|uniref:Uncharacterized protein n=1 Tax=Candidatus Giovannonibacteria bacterium GW2011_GWA2_53_7 TaxID=1618650 RepID=A0A0G2A8B1_9BACT|nr:MAG: hypothetical protein UY81_C0002G0020 [Candidatus Giovannonibacteria bacterium GW2011_GWA2_53_7]
MQHPIKYYLARSLSIAAFVIVVGYAYYQSRAVLEGPVIIVDEPVDGMTATSSFIRIAGRSTHAKELRLDGRPIFIDMEGHFDERLLLFPGYNIIELNATDAQGRTATNTLRLYYR